MEAEIYIHIPFCIRKCNYCDFLSFASCEEEREAYVEALCHELRETAEEAQDTTFRSIFIGGGTPSILKVEQMQKILDTVYESYALSEHAEISMEANPGTLDPEKLASYKEMGINRLSMGLQSTEDASLQKLGRIHTYEEFLKNYQEARKAGFENINIDLMSALPLQTVTSYRKTLETVAELGPEHISSYSLILEGGTPFYEDDSLIDLLPDEDSERAMYEMTQDILKQYGYYRYEISNYAKEGRECLHNLGYWDDIPYLGFGLGASSYWKGARFSNETSLAAYLEKPYIQMEEREDYHLLTTQERMEEYMFLGLRKRNGVSVREFERRYGVSMWDVYGKIIEKYQELHLMECMGDRLRLTDSGIDVSNRIFSEFLMNS